MSTIKINGRERTVASLSTADLAVAWLQIDEVVKRAIRSGPARSLRQRVAVAADACSAFTGNVLVITTPDRRAS